ncbi:signal transduction histidine kinase/CheY-like chemotaxis protein [Bradyrhizobium sp. LB7.1]
MSRRVADRIGSKADLSTLPAFRGANESRAYYGPVYFLGDTEPFMTLATRGTGLAPNVIVAEVNLRFIWDLVAGIRVGNTGKAYVVDRMGVLIAHPDLWPALRRSDLSSHADVRAALDGVGPPSGGLVKEDLSGQRVLSTYATVPSLGWLVFVELPLSEAYEPIYASIGRSTFLLVILLACAVLVSLFLSRRMTVPIQILTQGARRIESGDLGLRLAIKTGDELEALGDQFNRMAAHLRESYATLERKVIERTSELEKTRDQALAEHDAAERARSAAVAANETKSRFLAVVSHELRTPLNGVMGVLQLLDDGSLGEAQRRGLTTAAASGETLIALVDAILEYARLEASAETLETRDFRLDQLIETAVDLMRPQAFGKGLTFDLACDATVNTSVHGDPVRLNRILLNLIGNAIKFTPRGGIGLNAAAEHHDDRALLRITVRDTGIGIAPDMHERIFEDFVQADDSIARRFGGTGLGLAIARRLTRLMRGELTVASTPGAGSSFMLEVPLGIAASGIAQGAVQPSSRQLRVLLVDDDPVNCEVGEAMLKRLGHHPTIATNGASAIALARDRAFDIILMDLHMPDMDGVEAASRIGRLGLPRMPRIIAVTADVSRRARERLARGRHRQDRQQAYPDQRAARGDRGRTAGRAGSSATCRGRVDRPAFPRRAERAAGRDANRKAPPASASNERATDRRHRQGRRDWRTHAVRALRASTRQRRERARPRPPVRALPRDRAGSSHDVTVRMPECRQRAGRASAGLDERAGRIAPAGLTASGQLAAAGLRSPASSSSRPKRSTRKSMNNRTFTDRCRVGGYTA